MAETFEQYEKNKALVRHSPSLEMLIDTAMNQTELLQGVVRRVQAFVEAYQEWDDLEPSYQELRSVSRENGDLLGTLTFDDLKILLDKFPQRDF